MYLRPDDLLKYGGCYVAYSFMQRYYPDGAELTELMKHKYVTDEFLHFGFDNFEANDEEKALYYEILNIKCDNPASIYHCRDVEGCYLVTRSQRISNSTNIKDSTDINHSEYVVSCDSVENTLRASNSSFIYDSNSVIDSVNITNSAHVAGSKYVVDSTSIIDCENAIGCSWLRHCRAVEDCFLCADCHDLKHGLFCDGVSGEYMLFNKPIDPKQFELIKRQLLLVMRDWKMTVMGEWQLEGLSWSAPKKNLNYITQYADAPKKLWNWLATLPGYDPMMLYRITFQPHLLGE